ncbi:MAG: SsrA-binding protein SmpB [Candidatus Omnitrophica bacterium]|nr:SsrA-binding protein SmpB [Candidatus Omnitrophota bacterium]
MSEASLLATNRKALRDYQVLESFESGIMLVGTEIKAMRNRRVSLDDSFARIDEGEVFLYNMHVSPYEQGGRFNVEPKRQRKLLLHRQQIDRLEGLLSRRGLTLIPLRLYLKHGLAKVDLAVCKGKRQYEKRDVLRKRELDREVRRTFKAYRRKEPR